MTNEKAIKLIQKNHDSSDKAERVAAMFAMDDIIEQDIEEWMSDHVSENLEQFIEIGRDVASDYITDSITDKLYPFEAETLMEGIIGVAESMYHYSRFHKILTEESMSER